VVQEVTNPALSPSILTTPRPHFASEPTDQPVLSRTTTERLAAKRYSVSGSRAYSIGTTDGHYPPMGRHIEGSMGGFWAPPIKLLDGIWFALGSKWLTAARRFTSLPGHVKFDFPSSNGIEVSRLDFAPDGLPAVLVGLTLRNSSPRRHVTDLRLHARSNLMLSYPWSTSRPTARDLNKPDVGRIETNRLIFNQEKSQFFAMVGSSPPPDNI
jgi:hypothetical protein